MNSNKKKSDVASMLDDLRNEDPKKRMNAISSIKEVATALGPARVRSELIGFLAGTFMLTQSFLMTKKISSWNFLISWISSQLVSEGLKIRRISSLFSYHFARLMKEKSPWKPAPSLKGFSKPTKISLWILSRNWWRWKWTWPRNVEWYWSVVSFLKWKVRKIPYKSCMHLSLALTTFSWG